MFRQRIEIPHQLNIALISRFAPLTQDRSAGHLAGPSFLRLIARGLAFRGHNVTLLTGESRSPNPLNNANDDQVLDPDGVRIVKISSQRSERHRALKLTTRPRFDDLVRRKFIELHRAQPFQIVHALDDSAMRIGELKRRLDFALAYDVQATHLSDLFTIMGLGQESLSSIVNTGLQVGFRFMQTFLGHDRRLLRNADGVFVASPRERLSLERYYLYPDSKIHSVPYGIEVGAFHESWDDSTPTPVVGLQHRLESNFPEWLQLPDFCRVVVTVSDMNEVGELKSLISAFEKVVILKPNARLVIIGDGPCFKEIEYEVLSRALGSKVIFTGGLKHEDQVRAIAKGNVFVNLSARSSGFEPSLLEAMAQKKVVIGSEMSPISAMIENGVEGFLVRPADIEEITGLLLAVIEDRLHLEEMGSAARAKIASLFDPEKMVVETLRAYRSILIATGKFRRPK